MNVDNDCSNNTNKLSPQERAPSQIDYYIVQIIQINLVLKNYGGNIQFIAQFK